MVDDRWRETLEDGLSSMSNAPLQLVSLGSFRIPELLVIAITSFQTEHNHTHHDRQTNIRMRKHSILPNISLKLIKNQALRQAARPAAFAPKFALSRTLIASRFLSAETKQAIDKAVGTSPVVLFMKGTPETPQCGFSRATIQILGLQGVDPAKFTAFNVLEDEDLRQGMCRCQNTGLFRFAESR